MAHIEKVLVPERNRPDVEELSKEITKGMEIVYVKEMEEVIREAFVPVRRTERSGNSFGGYPGRNSGRTSLPEQLQKRVAAVSVHPKKKGKVMIIKDVNLETVCGITSKMPENTQPEFAFAGKSNVGKSSLINSLMNRKSYARISAQPGKTQTINFYHINDALYYVDLPGYGYAKGQCGGEGQMGKDDRGLSAPVQDAPMCFPSD